MNPNYRLVKVRAPRFRSDWVFPPLTQKEILFNAATAVYTEESVQAIEKLGFGKSCGCLMFYKPPGYAVDNAHVDRSSTTLIHPQVYALNVVYGGADSLMIWYEHPGYANNIPVEEMHAPYRMWKASNLKEVDRATLPDHKVVLTRVDLPHEVRGGTEGRWCVSMRFAEQPWLSNWDITVAHFKALNVIE